MWSLEGVFMLLLSLLLLGLSMNVSRVLFFLMYLEVFSLMMIFFLVMKKSSEDYTLILNVLMLMTCESAMGFSLLVMLVRSFSVDKLVVNNSKKCEGF